VARFDLYRNRSGAGFLLDCQTDLLVDLNTRLIVPILPRDGAPKPAGRLNPAFEIEGAPYLMVTQYAGAIEVRELGEKVASLADRDHEIINALDFLLTGV
jgi:toxin CcdB